MDVIDQLEPDHVREWPLGGLHRPNEELFNSMYSNLPSVYQDISSDDFNNSLELKYRE